jgi:MFS family permease
MSQFLFQTPAGYLYDYTESKVLWLSMAAIATTALTVFTAAFAQPYGANLSLMIFVKFLQGAVTSFIPPGLNSITQGIVGVAGMTSQVSTNEMMNHLGTAIIVLTGSVVGVILYPDLGFLFIVSPIACFGFLFFLNRIKLSDIDHAEARGLTSTTKKMEPPAVESYNPPDETNNAAKMVQDQPSFNFGWKNGDSTSVPSSGEAKAESPLRVLRDPILLTLYVITINLRRFTVHAIVTIVPKLTMRSISLLYLYFEVSQLYFYSILVMVRYCH